MKRKTTRTRKPALLLPPAGYASWLHYAVASMETRRLYHDYLFSQQSQWPAGRTRDDMYKAAEAELRYTLPSPLTPAQAEAMAELFDNVRALLLKTAVAKPR